MITSYSTLTTRVSDEFAGESFSANRIDLAIQAVEQDLNDNPNFLLDFMVVRETGSLTAGNSYITLPTDIKNIIGIILTGTDPIRSLENMGLGQFNRVYAATATGQPRAYAVAGVEAKFGPQPDSAYAYEIAYYGQILASGGSNKTSDQKSLTSTNTTNWLITNRPMIYFHGVVTHLLSYVGQDQRARLGTHPELYQRAVDQAVMTARKHRFPSGPVFSIPLTHTP